MVCGEAGNGLEAIEKSVLLKPDVVILDVAMPEMHGLDAARHISVAVPDLPILIFTNYVASRETRRETRKYGVWELVSKAASTEKLVNVLEALEARQSARLKPSAEKIRVRAASAKPPKHKGKYSWAA